MRLSNAPLECAYRMHGSNAPLECVARRRLSRARPREDRRWWCAERVRLSRVVRVWARACGQPQAGRPATQLAPRRSFLFVASSLPVRARASPLYNCSQLALVSVVVKLRYRNFVVVVFVEIAWNVSLKRSTAFEIFCIEFVPGHFFGVHIFCSFDFRFLD